MAGFAITLKHITRVELRRIGFYRNGADVVIRPTTQACFLQYDSGSALWYVLGA
jgi:hypothetical protein